MKIPNKLLLQKCSLLIWNLLVPYANQIRFPIIYVLRWSTQTEGTSSHTVSKTCARQTLPIPRSPLYDPAKAFHTPDRFHWLALIPPISAFGYEPIVLLLASQLWSRFVMKYAVWASRWLDDAGGTARWFTSALCAEQIKALHLPLLKDEAVKCKKQQNTWLSASRCVHIKQQEEQCHAKSSSECFF